MSKSAYIGIGSNLDNPLKNCQEAIGRLAARNGISIAARSSFYKTEPVGITDQDWFVNAVVEVRTTLPAPALLEVLLEIEREMGRVREKKWGPRLIDLDLLFQEDAVLDLPGLTLPHPEIPRRRFILAPMSEIAGGFFHPVLKKTVDELLAELPESPRAIRIADAL
ncbi:MAG: 2-amino-4-hydroxy-6-hydroxymethyldihydropteridine diphosphokinase [Nitrospinae bacterium]|nr:2-amino-4-hydroxy-6-hydroxymethyldihydropteridine diphosphokinase [Nitrospinota bacterium]